MFKLVYPTLLALVVPLLFHDAMAAILQPASPSSSREMEPEPSVSKRLKLSSTDFWSAMAEPGQTRGSRDPRGSAEFLFRLPCCLDVDFLERKLGEVDFTRLIVLGLKHVPLVCSDVGEELCLLAFQVKPSFSRIPSSEQKGICDARSPPRKDCKAKAKQSSSQVKCPTFS